MKIIENMPEYKKILLKLSGESLSGKEAGGINPEALLHYATEIKSITRQGVQTAVVLGGGNIFRGLQGEEKGFDRVQGDYMGMLATVINSMALQGALESLDVKARVLSGLSIDPLCERMSRKRANELLNQGYVVIIAGGTGNPFFTTDSAAALRAIEIEADVLLKGTRVDGIYTADPEKDPTAKKLEKISFRQAYSQNLKIMDLTAFTLCMENKMPIIVFDVNKAGILFDIAVSGKSHGTIVTD
jgi:uridylate kinase